MTMVNAAQLLSDRFQDGATQPQGPTVFAETSQCTVHSGVLDLSRLMRWYLGGF